MGEVAGYMNYKYNESTVAPEIKHANNGTEADFATFDRINDFLQIYVVPIIIITGFLGNSICFIVFVASPLKRISTSVYLAALAFSDTGFLVCLSIGWLESFGIRFFHKDGICQMTVYASFVFSFTSVWFVAAFTTEMYIAVFHSRKSARLCVPKNAKRIVCLLSVVACLLYMYVFWIAKVVPTSSAAICRTVQGVKSATIVSVVDTILTLVVPFTMIMFMITRLFMHISKFYESGIDSTRTTETYGEEGDASENLSGSQSQSQSQSQTTPAASGSRTARHASDVHAKLTRMLVVTVVVFLVLNLPSHAIKVQYLFRSLLSENPGHIKFTEMEGIFQTIFQTLYYANFSVNFLLYSVCGKSFRSALMRTSTGFCVSKCKRLIDCPQTIQRFTMKTKLSRGSVENDHNATDQQHSRLVDIHLNEIRFSQLPSLGSQFVCQSPPCLLASESEHRAAHSGE